MSTSSLSWSALTEKLTSGLDLERKEIQDAMSEILSGESDIESVKNFLLALKAKGETSEEVGALIEVMYAHAGPISIKERAVDTVGTGGDGAHTINISTTASIIAAAAGARVVKHGNRAVSSRSGASDFLEALGVVPGLDGAGVERTVRELGIGFCFAPTLPRKHEAHSQLHHLSDSALPCPGVGSVSCAGVLTISPSTVSPLRYCLPSC